MKRFHGQRGHARAWAAVAVSAAMVFTLVGVGAATAATSKAKPHAVAGGTAYFAEAPSSVPNFIFPYVNFSYFSTTNISQFQYLLYRPL